MSQVRDLAAVYKRHVSAPWPRTLAGAQRVMMIVYPKNRERALRAAVGEFEQATLGAGREWRLVDCTGWFAEWMAGHEYREPYFEEPELLDGALLDQEFRKAASARLESALKGAGEKTVVGLVGVASLYGFVRVSKLIHDVERSIEGRLAAVATSRRGSEVRKALARPPFGWPRDAVDAALVALHGLGQLAATRNGAPVRRLDQTGIATTVFRPETVVLDASQRIALRGLFQKAGVASISGEEAVGARQFLDALRTLAAKAGGDAPLPAPPDTGLLDEIGRLDGNEQLAELFEAREGLIADIEQWKRLGRRARTRTPAWDMAVALRRHAAGLPIAEDVGAELDAIAERRSLLDEMDPVSPCVAKLAKALREALGTARDGLAEAVADATARLDADRAWSELDDADRAAILSDVALAAPVPLAVETDPALRRELDRRNLAAWRTETDAVSSREAEALEAATARHGEGNVPVAVAVRRATLADETDVRRWLDEHEMKLMEVVKKGTVVVK